MSDRAVRTRREPPRFRRLVVRSSRPAGGRLVAVVLGGPELEGFTLDAPAASVRVLLPEPGTDEPTLPTWRGNEFLLPDGRRPTIRTLTPRRLDVEARELEVQVVLHGEGAISTWAASVQPGAVVGLSGPGRGYEVDRSASGFLLAGDETALPAMGQLLEVLPGDVPVAVLVEVDEPDGRMDLPGHPTAAVGWHELAEGDAPGTALLAAVRDAPLEPGTAVWAAGEAAGVQRIRRHLFDERGLPRSQATVRGYWKAGRAEGEAGSA